MMLPDPDHPFSDPADVLRDVVETGQMYFDLETTGLDPLICRIGIVIIGTDRAVHILREPPPWGPTVLADPAIRKVGFNLKFDLAFLLQYYGPLIVRNLHDLYIEELLISARRQGQRHDLATTLDRRLGISIAKEVDHSQVDWTGDLTEQMVRYAVEDVQHMPALDQELDRLLEQTGQTRAAEIENNVVLATAYMGINGLGIDRPAWEGAAASWRARADELLEQLDAAVPEPLNWNSPAQVVRAFNALFEQAGLSVRVDSVRKEILADLPDLHPILPLYREWKRTEKRASSWGATDWAGLDRDGEGAALRTYLDETVYWERNYKRTPGNLLGYLDKYVHPVDGRIHASWWQIGADTCRYSTSSPNVQQLPHDKEFRGLVRAREGHVLASIDFQQIEVLTAAVFANDERMLANFYQGVDTHRMAVQICTGTPLDQIDDDMRQMGKAVNFGLQFGGQAAMLAAYARRSFGVKNFSESDAKVSIRRYFAHYRGLACKRQEAYAWADANRHKAAAEVRNLVGMRRILVGPQIKPTTYLNTIIQSSAGHGIKCAMYRAQTQGLLPYLCAQVHDELVWEFPEDRAEELTEVAKRCMIVGMRDVLGPAPVGVDAQLGRTWAG